MDTIARHSSSLDDLCAAAERAWTDRRDPTTVDRLAAEHPEHAEELYDFFADLVVGAREAIPREAARRAAERTRRWLGEEGFDRALAAARRPRSFASFLRELAGPRPDEAVRRIGDVSWEFLALVSRYPAVVPPVVREELASRVARAWDLRPEACLERIEASSPALRAASRKRPYPPPPSTFEELLARSSLGGKARSYWREVAERR